MKLKSLLIAVTLAAFTLLAAAPASAKVSLDTVKTDTCTGSKGKSAADAAKKDNKIQKQLDEGKIKADDCVGGQTLTGIIQTVVNVLLFLVGAIAVIMLIVGAFRYVTSGGDSNATKGAKDTILYAIIGIIVAFAAYAIVKFIVDQLLLAK